MALDPQAYPLVWERFIGLTKSVLKKVLGCTHATMESLQTIVVQVDAMLNNCPLPFF